MTRVVMCHMDRTIFTQEGALEIARTGCYMEFDLFGAVPVGISPYFSARADCHTMCDMLISFSFRILFSHKPGNYVSGFYPHNPEVDMPNDAGRIAWLRWLISEGYRDRLLVAQDICFRHRLSKYGGHGFHYILAEIAPRMLTRGLSAEDVESILTTNPAAVLSFAAPQPEAMVLKQTSKL